MAFNSHHGYLLVRIISSIKRASNVVSVVENLAVEELMLFG